MAEYRELLIGCGNHRDKLIGSPGHEHFDTLVTLDIDPNCGADIEWDLERLPLPFKDDEFDECHAYHTLEHVGRQGDWRFFFAQFGEFYRILKPGGVFCGVVPALNSDFLWGDPGHTRVLPPAIMTYLDQAAYAKQVGVTALADYRHVWKGDFIPWWENHDSINRQFMFVLKVVKPAGAGLEERIAA